MDFTAFVRRVGANVRKARWAAAMSQEELATDVLTFRLVAELERGNGNPTLRTLFGLARKLDVTVAELLDVQPTRLGHVPLTKRTARPPRRGRKPKPPRRST